MELKPCPFCGGKAELTYYPLTRHRGFDRWQVACDKCGAVTAGMLSKEDAAEAWNRRCDNG